MNPVTGRCAILLPHGVLFRNEEQTIREKLVKSDLIECIIGIGKNLFFNSPMEACILICRSKKPHERVGKVLFVNAKDLVTRNNNFSYLEDKHIKKISDAYKKFCAEDKFSAVASIGDILANGSKLSIPLYVTTDLKFNVEEDESTIGDYYGEWINSADTVHSCIDSLITDLGGNDNE